VVNNITINVMVIPSPYPLTPYLQATPPPPGKKPTRRKRPDKAKRKEEKEVEPAEEGDKPSSE
jgi:hypothetical protein